MKRLVMECAPPPIEKQVAHLAEYFDISEAEAARRLAVALNSDVTPLATSGP